jgi:hypothetical protein
MTQVSITRTPGLTVYAFPEGFSLADWTRHRVMLTEGSAPNTGIYTGSLDESKSKMWRFFVGAGQPGSWDAAKGFFDLGDSVDLQILLARTTSNTVVFNAVPVAQDGSISEIIIGDDYLAANDRAFRWTVGPVANLTIGNAECHFGGSLTLNGVTHSWLVQGSLTIDGSNWVLSFDLPRTATEALPEGLYRWSVEVRGVSNGPEITRVKSASCGMVRLRGKQT